MPNPHSDDVFSAFRANLFPQGDLSEFWQAASRALAVFALITTAWLGYAGVRMVMSRSWSEVEAISSARIESSGYSTGVYTYTVDGETYAGSRYFFGGNSFLNHLPDDRKIHVNLEQPAQSVVYRRYSSSHAGFFLLMIGAIWLRGFIYRNYAR